MSVSTSYVVVGTVAGVVLWWAWFTYLFPKVREELRSGGEGSFKLWFVGAIASAIFAWALGQFLLNRDVANFGDAMRVGFKVWIGFLLPIIGTFWAATGKSLNALVATAGVWLVQTLVLIVLATWLLL